MFVSHKHKLIFLHARKCAGTSIEVMFSKSLGPFDIQVGSWNEILMAGNIPNLKSCLNSFGNLSMWPLLLRGTAATILARDLHPIATHFNASVKQPYLKTLGPNPSCPTAKALKSQFTNCWNNYFKFSIVRNPFNFEVSDYLWRTKLTSHYISFVDFLRLKASAQTTPHKLIPYPPTNWPIYTLNNDIALDFICTFENLSSDLSYLSNLLNIPALSYPLPRTKASKWSGHVSEFYNSEAVDLVYTLHAHELATFNYSIPF